MAAHGRRWASDGDGSLTVFGRLAEVVVTGGRRCGRARSSGSSAHPNVAEVTVWKAADPNGANGWWPGWCRPTRPSRAELDELRARVGGRAGAVGRPKELVVVEALPRTPSARSSGTSSPDPGPSGRQFSSHPSVDLLVSGKDHSPPRNWAEFFRPSATRPAKKYSANWPRAIVTVGGLTRPLAMSLAAACERREGVDGWAGQPGGGAGRGAVCAGLVARPLAPASAWLQFYGRFWEERLDRLEELFPSGSPTTGEAG